MWLPMAVTKAEVMFQFLPGSGGNMMDISVLSCYINIAPCQWGALPDSHLRKRILKYPFQEDEGGSPVFGDGRGRCRMSVIAGYGANRSKRAEEFTVYSMM